MYKRQQHLATVQRRDGDQVEQPQAQRQDRRGQQEGQDVYKRQVCHRGTLVSDSVPTQAGSGKITPRPRRARRSACLLYTSRCV